MLSADREKELREFCGKIGIKTEDFELFNTALTHPSFNSELNIEGEDYERLEFLGDSAVRLVASNYLFDKYPDFDEGKLTKIRSYAVSDYFFAKVATDIGLDKYINIGKHEEKDGGRKKQSVLACATEALFGAVYKSCGYAEVKNFIYLIYDKEEINSQEILHSYNSKEILQQYTQGKNKDLPEYKLLNETGKAHNKLYETAVYYENREIGRGTGKTKKESEKKAASDAIKNLNIEEES